MGFLPLVRAVETRLFLYWLASRCANGAFFGWVASTTARCKGELLQQQKKHLQAQIHNVQTIPLLIAGFSCKQPLLETNISNGTKMTLSKFTVPYRLDCLPHYEQVSNIVPNIFVTMVSNRPGPPKLKLARTRFRAMDATNPYQQADQPRDGTVYGVRHRVRPACCLKIVRWPAAKHATRVTTAWNKCQAIFDRKPGGS